MANFTITPETVRFSSQRSSAIAKKIGGWTRRILLAPVPDFSPHRKDGAPSESEEQKATRAAYDALSEDGPFSRITAEEAHRHAVFACVYYALLGAGILAIIFFH